MTTHVSLLHDNHATIALELLDEVGQWIDRSASSCMLSARGDTCRPDGTQDLVLLDNDMNPLATLESYGDNDQTEGSMSDFTSTTCSSTGWTWRKSAS